MMRLRAALFLSVIGIFAVQACHHRKDEFPPDNFPEDDDDDLPSRRKRQTEQFYIIQTTQSTPKSRDVDKKLSDFFTKCMSEKTGSFFPSWRSVVDFVFRDTRWYSSTDEQYCQENSNRNPNSVKCWQNRLENLLQVNSRLLEKGKECVEEFEWAETENFRVRGKRQVTSSSESSTESCLGISRARYGQCVQGDLVTRANMREYPSLRDWDQKSVDQFVSEHYTSCRITSRYVGGRNVYTEACPRGYRNPLFPRPKQTCLSSVYHDVVRTPSPLYGATKKCIEQYSDDKCQGVRCTRPNQRCDQNTGRCVCDVGYERDWKGDCVLENKCVLVFCGGQHETCDPRTGQCVCQSGYTRDQDGICKILNPCSLVFCGGRNEVCDPNTGRCVCRPGYTRDRNEICRIRVSDPCIGHVCGINEQCVTSRGRALCICIPGFQRLTLGVCTFGNPCSGVDCGSHGECKIERGTGVCECDRGYQLQNGVCREIDACARVRCARFMRCRVNPRTGRPRCECLPGYVPAKTGPGCERPDPCDNVNCPPNSRCVRGACVCNRGFEERNGRCVPINPCENHSCRRNMRCTVNPITGGPQCECLPGYVPAQAGDGCVLPDPCRNVRCPVNSRCIRGECICNRGYEKDENGRCVRPNPCEGVRCPPRSRCVAGECVCNAGLVKNERGQCVTPNPCEGVRCPPRSRCVAGECVCNAGLVKNERGQCVSSDACTGVRCPPRSRCFSGECVCNAGLVKNERGQCVNRDPCENFCSTNEICVLVGGQPECRCAEGFALNEFGECRDSDPCGNVQCEVNMECRGGSCFCLEGFVKWPIRPGCRRRSPCEGVNCSPDRECVAGQCVCKSDFVPVDGVCRPRDRCADVTCAANMRCRNGNCVCLEGFVPNLGGEGCRRSRGVWQPWSEWRECSSSCGGGTQLRFRNCDGESCDGEPVDMRPCNELPCTPDDPCRFPVEVNCPENSQCVNGQCVCNPNTNRLQDGQCISCPSDKIFNECPTSCYDRCGSSSPSTNASVCIAVCRPNVYCVCPEGMIETSATDSTCVRPSDCPAFWGPWGRWARCSRTCGGGVQLRRRRCRGTGCQGGATESRPCNQQACEGRCESPKVYQRCPTSCPKNCANNGIEILCTSGCRNDTNCVCPEGMVETSPTVTTCVNPSECPGLCFPNPCKHGGRCLAFGAAYRCRCEEGYSGKTCEVGCGRFCRPNGRCIRGNCVCNQGFVSNGEGGCRRR